MNRLNFKFLAQFIKKLSCLLNKIIYYEVEQDYKRVSDKIEYVSIKANELKLKVTCSQLLKLEQKKRELLQEIKAYDDELNNKRFLVKEEELKMHELLEYNRVLRARNEIYKSIITELNVTDPKILNRLKLIP